MPRAKVLPVPARPDDQGDPLAALAQVADHRLLIRSGGGMRGQGLAHRLMGGHGRLLARPAGGARDQPLLDRQEVGGGPAALLQGPVGDHADRPLGQEPVRQLLQLGPSGAGQAGAEGDQDVGAGEGGRVRGQPVRAGQPVEQPTGQPQRTPSGPGRGWLSGRSPSGPGCPGPLRARPPPVRQRSYRVSGVSCCLGLRVAWTAHLTSRGVRSRPSATSRSSSASIWPVRLEKPRTSASGIPWSSRLPWRVRRPSTPLPVSGRARVGRWPGRWRPRPADAGTGPGRPRPSSVRPAPGRGWPRPDGCAAADRPLGRSGGRTRPPAAPVRTRAGHRHGRGGPPGARPGRRPPRPAQHDGRPAPPGRSPGHPGRRGPRRSWSAAGPHRRPGTALRPCGRPSSSPVVGVAALEHGLEPGHGCFALQPQAAGAGAVPPAWGLTVAGQILLVVGGQLAGVILLPPHRELGDVGHHPAAPSRLRWRQRTHPWCIALLGKDCGLE